jgi:hypothetical protein
MDSSLVATETKLSPVVIGVGLLALGVGAYFLLKKPTRARPNKKRKKSRYSSNSNVSYAGEWFRQDVGGRTYWFWAITKQKKPNSYSGVTVVEGDGRPKAKKDSVDDWRLWTNVRTGDVPRYVLHVADEKLLELTLKKR